MSTEQLTEQAMSLPLAERVSLAEALWRSIDEELAALAPDEERAAIVEAMRRDAELSGGVAVRRTHDQVMGVARRALGDDLSIRSGRWPAGG